jgi:hypothetical protein
MTKGVCCEQKDSISQLQGPVVLPESQGHLVYPVTNKEGLVVRRKWPKWSHAGCTQSEWCAVTKAMQDGTQSECMDQALKPELGGKIQEVCRVKPFT